MKHLRIITVAVLIGILLPQFSGAVWFDTDWSNKFPLTSSSTLVTENLTNYPAFYDCANAPAGFWTTVKGDGSDIRITSSSQIGALNHELVAISTSSQTCEIHFDTVSLSSTVADTFYIYYGNAGASSISTSSTWNSDYKVVLHMNQEPTSNTAIKDSTANSNDSIEIGGTMTAGDLVEASIGKGIEFDGLNDFIELPNNAGTEQPRTILVWIKTGTLDGGTASDTVVNNDGEGLEDNIYLIRLGTTGGRVSMYDSTATVASVAYAAFSNNTDYHLGLTYASNGDLVGFRDGSSVGSDTTTLDGSFMSQTRGTHLGTRIDSDNKTRLFPGVIFEFRMLDIVLSTGEILTTFNNQASSTAFFAAGAEENVPVSVNNIGGIRMGFGF